MSTAGQRKAAACLATLDRRDRAWLLRRLSPAERRQLERLLDSPAMVALAFMGDVDVGDVLAPAIDGPTASAEWRQSSISAVADGLPPAWAALWLATSRPERFDDYVANQAHERADALMRARHATGAVPPGLAGALAGWPGGAGL